MCRLCTAYIILQIKCATEKEEEHKCKMISVSLHPRNSKLRLLCSKFCKISKIRNSKQHFNDFLQNHIYERNRNSRKYRKNYYHISKSSYVHKYINSSGLYVPS